MVQCTRAGRVNEGKENVVGLRAWMNSLHIRQQRGACRQMARVYSARSRPDLAALVWAWFGLSKSPTLEQTAFRDGAALPYEALLIADHTARAYG